MRRFVRRTLLATAVPIALTTATSAHAAVPHTVSSGETLWSIAAANGMSVSSLATFNGVSDQTKVIEGATVMIPAPGEIPAAPAPATPAAAAPATPASPAPPAHTHPSPGAAAEAGPVVAPATSPHLHPHPTQERLSAAQVGDAAEGSGVERSLTQAVGWQESGFNNAAVSEAGARGVMQIMPGTWDFIQTRLAEGQLDPKSATDNVRAGALYLHYLHHLKGSGDAAVAAYYQGPNRTALLAETQTYLEAVRGHQEHFRQAGH